MIQGLELLRGKQILVVEDDYLVADRTRHELARHGAGVIGPVSAVDAALDLLTDTRVDAAILDIRLDGEEVYRLADVLAEREIPFVFATAYDPQALPARFRGFILCEKPVELAVIAVALFAPERLSH